ncbi:MULTISPECIES: AAA family ATPase [Sphingobacterium]|uniref:AAA family ATPase n=1 Tax=Sphingobacterium TaxID=28453 RepID=UPI00257C57F0|nr:MULTISPECIES: AAA family ATPase [Sphingobacterium]
MLTEINLKNVASYKETASLKTDGKINLIYGLNGTGKSTFSTYFQNISDLKYKDCSIQGLDDSKEILVYNQSFIHQNFYEPENLNGIFTLSKENKEAEIKILSAQSEVDQLNIKLKSRNEERIVESTNLYKKQEEIKNLLWKVKTDYSGGDRVLEFCLDGYKGSKDNLSAHLISLACPSEKPNKTIDDLKDISTSISGENATKYTELNSINIDLNNIELSNLFSKQIVGNSNSSVSYLINRLNNSDWVKEGLSYLSDLDLVKEIDCPFCQQPTLTHKLIEDIKSYFDVSYEEDLNRLTSFRYRYNEVIQELPNKSLFESNPKLEPFRKDFEIAYENLKKVLLDNEKIISEKIKTPSVSLQLIESSKFVLELNLVIEKANESIIQHNSNLDQEAAVRAKIKKDFWSLMRWNYDQSIKAFVTEKDRITKKLDSIMEVIVQIEGLLKIQFEIIQEQQGRTINVDEAIKNINDGLLDLGISEFNIQKHSKNLYKIVRGEEVEKVFRSLSEGEKMIISFLYFIELCRGRKGADDLGLKKIIIIDDPISSLSHIYVFNVGRLIKKEFFPKKKKNKDQIDWLYNYEQVFILTHSLYFFYEITETKHEDRKETQKLFRLAKSDQGSLFKTMKYEEIQNDYQAYWYVIKDESQHPALIANCMRNIIEYFFNFVEKKDLNNFFNQEPLNSNRFQAFYRFINRESHSLGQNIFDYKEFNYKDFKDAFIALFDLAGYDAHCKKMMN